MVSAVHIHLLASIGFERDHFAHSLMVISRAAGQCSKRGGEVKIEYPYTVAQVEEEMLDFYEGGTNGVLWFKVETAYITRLRICKSRGGIAEIKPAKIIWIFFKIR